MTGWHFGSRHRRTASAEAQEQTPHDNPRPQDRGVNRSSTGNNNSPAGHNEFQTLSVPGYTSPGVPFGPQLTSNIYPHPPVLDPLAYEQWQLNYALALSANEQAAKHQQATSLLLGIQSQPTPVDISTKGQAEALSYKFWATGRCVICMQTLSMDYINFMCHCA